MPPSPPMVRMPPEPRDPRPLPRDLDPRAGAVLSAWLYEVGPAGWYDIDPDLDARLADRFAGLVGEGEAGRLMHWLACPRGALALCILLDQLPRNIRRGSAAAFACDARALAAAKHAIAAGHDLRIAEPERQFFYLPLMHSERLPDQNRCVRLVAERLRSFESDNLSHAIRHRDVIVRFGRFPSRNALLGRSDTDAERAYRAAGGYMG